MKKLVGLLLMVCVLLTGCGAEQKNLCGQDKIESLREQAANWQSGRYLFTDIDSGIMDRAFSFMYNADGSQTYLYETVNGTDYYAEYNDGKEMYILDGGNISMLKAGSPDFVSYSHDDPHPYSKNDLFFYVAPYVANSLESTDGDGNTVYVYDYDTEKMNKAVGTTLTAFRTEYHFDSAGNFLYFTQSNTGSDGTYSYRIDVTDIDSLTEIENPCI